MTDFFPSSAFICHQRHSTEYFICRDTTLHEMRDKQENSTAQLRSLFLPLSFLLRRVNHPWRKVHEIRKVIERVIQFQTDYYCQKEISFSVKFTESESLDPQ